MSFELLSSLAFTDAQYDELTSPSPLTPVVMIHGSYIQADGNGPVRVVGRPGQITQKIARGYARQLPMVESATFAGKIIIDYEPWTGDNGSAGKSPISKSECETLLIEAVTAVREIFPAAQLAVWGIPSPAIYDREGEKKTQLASQDFNRLWPLVDFVCPHVYYGSNVWHAGAVYSTVTRIAEALYVDKPIYPVVCPRPQPNKPEWIDTEYTLERAMWAQDMRCDGLIYWDGKKAAEQIAANFEDKWATDCELLRAEFEGVPVPEPEPEPSPQRFRVTGLDLFLEAIR